MVKDDFKKLYNQRTMDWFIRHNFEWIPAPPIVIRAYDGLENLQRNVSIGGQCIFGTYIFNTKTREITFEKKE